MCSAVMAETDVIFRHLLRGPPWPILRLAFWRRKLEMRGPLESFQAPRRVISPCCAGATVTVCIDVPLAWIPCSHWTPGHSLQKWCDRTWQQFETAGSPSATWTSRTARRCRCRSLSSSSQRSNSPNRIWWTSARWRPSTTAGSTSPESRSSENSRKELFTVDWSSSAKRQLDQEIAWWDQNRTAAYGSLDTDVLRTCLVGMLRLLGAQPYIGMRQANAGRHARRLLLRESGLWMIYRARVPAAPRDPDHEAGARTAAVTPRPCRHADTTCERGHRRHMSLATEKTAVDGLYLLGYA